MKIQSQQGFLLIVAIILIVIISAFAAAIVYMFGGSAASSFKYQASKQAFYLAEAGLEKGLHALITEETSSHIDCNNFATNLHNINFGNGRFTVTCQLYNPTPATLNANISATATTIPLSSTTGYSPQGRIAMDNEVIHYTGISGNNLTGAVRGADDTTPTVHWIGASAIQNHYTLTSTGSVTTSGKSIGNHSVITNILLSKALWAVGDNGALFFWNGSVWIEKTAPPGIDVNLNDVSFLQKPPLGFAVGDNGIIIKFNTDSWTEDLTVPAAVTENLNGVDIISTTQAWAVGNNGVILTWNGNAWSKYTLTTPTIHDLQAISMDQSGGFGFAVDNYGNIIKYNGATWQFDAQPNGQALYAVITLSDKEAWAVGDKGTVLRWDGTNWTEQTLGITARLYAVDMIDTDGDGYANKGLISGEGNKVYKYDTSEAPLWSVHSVGGTHYAIIILSEDDMWVVGKGDKNIAHSSDGGINWDSISIGSNAAIKGIESTNNVYLTGLWGEIIN